MARGRRAAGGSVGSGRRRSGAGAGVVAGGVAGVVAGGVGGAGGACVGPVVPQSGCTVLRCDLGRAVPLTVTLRAGRINAVQCGTD